MHKRLLAIINTIKIIRIIILKSLGISYLRKGKCKKCGNCCRNITFSLENDLIKDIRQFDVLKEFIPGTYEHFIINGKDCNGVLLFTCKYLNPDNTCNIYYLRSLYCILYPRLGHSSFDIGENTLPGCGYYYESIESFRSVYDKLCNSSKNTI